MITFPIIIINDFYKFSKGQQTRTKNNVINQIKRAHWDNNYPLKKSKFTKNLYNQFIKTAKKQLGKFKIKDMNKDICWAVASNKDFIPSVNWHNHIMTSTINSVYYLNIPRDMKGGEIQFKNRSGNVLTLKPKNNQLLIFPGWMWHNPVNVKSDELRLSINMEIITQEKMEDVFNLLK